MYYVKLTAMSCYGLDGQKIAVVAGLYAKCPDSSKARASLNETRGVFAKSVRMRKLGCMNRGDLTHERWEQFAPLLPPQKPPRGRPAADHRRILNGMLWILRTGAP